MKQEDVDYMRLALQEANKGRGRTSPNPCVGAIIIRDNVIVGKGYHRKAGTPHAEVNAIEDAGSNTVGATIYVTLEPCNHTGRTPPCTKAIIDAGLSRVDLDSHGNVSLLFGLKISEGHVGPFQ